ncbi:MAG: hypothetical protein ACYTAF_08165, partial [Planctomycetota bacterium]
MPIRFQCPTTGKTLAAKDEHAGKLIKCPACGSPHRVPQSAVEPATAPTAAAAAPQPAPAAPSAPREPNA